MGGSASKHNSKLVIECDALLSYILLYGHHKDWDRWKKVSKRWKRLILQHLSLKPFASGIDEIPRGGYVECARCTQLQGYDRRARGMSHDFFPGKIICYDCLVRRDNSEFLLVRITSEHWEMLNSTYIPFLQRIEVLSYEYKLTYNITNCDKEEEYIIPNKDWKMLIQLWKKHN